MNKQIRELENNLVAVLNASGVPYECKRVILENLSIKCEVKALEEMAQETITEKGEMEDGTINTGFTGVDEVSQCSKE